MNQLTTYSEEECRKGYTILIYRDLYESFNRAGLLAEPLDFPGPKTLNGIKTKAVPEWALPEGCPMLMLPGPEVRRFATFPTKLTIVDRKYEPGELRRV